MNLESSHRKYLIVFVSLMALLALSVGAAFVDLGAGNVVVALAIAAAKALLVGLFFMHLLHSPRLMPVIAISGVLWFGLLVVLAMADYTTRPRPEPNDVGEQQETVAASPRPSLADALGSRIGD